MAVVLGWFLMPFLTGVEARAGIVQLQPALVHPIGLLIGVLLIVLGYAGTLWCYAAMGDQWRMGIDPQNASPFVTLGPYKTIRHPIYSFQILMLIGSGCLLPAGLPLLLLLLHVTCVHFKAQDEEAHLTAVHGRSYREYLDGTGRLWPRLRSP
jgi:protein-S-isoprenylcysteine O-methyltransferase Ste14